MHFLYLDESGTPPRKAEDGKYFVLAGLIVSEHAWHPLRDAVHGMKVRRGLRGELKWRFFAPENEDERNPMRRLSQEERNEIRTELCRIVTSDRTLRIIACVCSAAAIYEIESIASQEDVYNLCFKSATERFQYYLQDMSRSVGRPQFGIVVCDHRNTPDDKRLRIHHQKLLYTSAANTANYKNLIEGLFLTPSNDSIGIQMADLVAGAVWRHFERNDSRWFETLRQSFRTSSTGELEGYGLIKVPKRGWR